MRGPDRRWQRRLAAESRARYAASPFGFLYKSICSYPFFESLLSLTRLSLRGERSLSQLFCDCIACFCRRWSVRVLPGSTARKTVRFSSSASPLSTSIKSEAHWILYSKSLLRIKAPLAMAGRSLSTSSLSRRSGSPHPARSREYGYRSEGIPPRSSPQTWKLPSGRCRSGLRGRRCEGIPEAS